LIVKLALELKGLVAGTISSLLATLLMLGVGVSLQRNTSATRHEGVGATEPPAQPELKVPSTATHLTQGRTLFLKNCAHCHGDDARGDEGPDLHGLERSNEWIARRIRNGVKGQMTAFGDKFSSQDIDAIIAFLRSLKRP